ncbi:MAG: hypothetical protein ACI846_001426 [Pseudoalteromonas distincta]|jgi:hypothetical protein
MYSLIGTTEWIRVTDPWTGWSRVGSAFSFRCTFIYLFYLNVGTTEWIRTADLWTG